MCVCVCNQKDAKHCTVLHRSHSFSLFKRREKGGVHLRLHAKAASTSRHNPQQRGREMTGEGGWRSGATSVFLLHLFKHINAPFSRHAACFTVAAQCHSAVAAAAAATLQSYTFTQAHNRFKLELSL